MRGKSSNCPTIEDYAKRVQDRQEAVDEQRDQMRDHLRLDGILHFDHCPSLRPGARCAVYRPWFGNALPCEDMTPEGVCRQVYAGPEIEGVGVVQIARKNNLGAGVLEDDPECVREIRFRRKLRQPAQGIYEGGEG